MHTSRSYADVERNGKSIPRLPEAGGANLVAVAIEAYGRDKVVGWGLVMQLVREATGGSMQ